MRWQGLGAGRTRAATPPAWPATGRASSDDGSKSARSAVFVRPAAPCRVAPSPYAGSCAGRARRSGGASARHRGGGCHHGAVSPDIVFFVAPDDGSAVAFLAGPHRFASVRLGDGRVLLRTRSRRRDDRRRSPGPGTSSRKARNERRGHGRQPLLLVPLSIPAHRVVRTSGLRGARLRRESAHEGADPVSSAEVRGRVLGLAAYSSVRTLQEHQSPAHGVPASAP